MFHHVFGYVLCSYSIDLINSDTEEESDDGELQECLRESLKTYEEESKR